MPLETKLFRFIIIIWLLSLGGMVQAQQEKGQGDTAGGGRSPSEYNSYMGGKEHYLTDSPHYMAGKKHYLQGVPSPNTGNIGPGNDPNSPSKEKMASGERKKPDDPGGTQIQIEINGVLENPPKEYGIIYLPVIQPRHHGGKGKFPPRIDPNPPQPGNFNPGTSSGFHQGAINFR